MAENNIEITYYNSYFTREWQGDKWIDTTKSDLTETQFRNYGEEQKSNKWVGAIRPSNGTLFLQNAKIKFHLQEDSTKIILQIKPMLLVPFIYHYDYKFYCQIFNADQGNILPNKNLQENDSPKHTIDEYPENTYDTSLFLALPQTSNNDIIVNNEDGSQELWWSEIRENNQLIGWRDALNSYGQPQGTYGLGKIDTLTLTATFNGVFKKNNNYYIYIYGTNIPNLQGALTITNDSLSIEATPAFEPNKDIFNTSYTLNTFITVEQNDNTDFQGLIARYNQYLYNIQSTENKLVMPLVKVILHEEIKYNAPYTLVLNKITELINNVNDDIVSMFTETDEDSEAVKEQKATKLNEWNTLKNKTINTVERYAIIPNLDIYYQIINFIGLALPQIE